jgi:uncharacterized repeat protein (TIGR03803 family)
VLKTRHVVTIGLKPPIMKNISFAILCFFCLNNATEAQSLLYGTTAEGGGNDVGVLFSFDPSAGTYKKLVDFEARTGAFPSGTMVQADDGKLYGISGLGGDRREGAIFSFNPVTGVYAAVFNFGGTEGGSPTGGLVKAASGLLYGMTNGGTTNGTQVIYSFNPATGIYTRLYVFTNRNTGLYPVGKLVQASDGSLYGMTNEGGENGNGTLFSFDPITATYTKLVDFGSSFLSQPTGNLTQARDGKLYGVASYGGSTGDGVIFSFDPLTHTYANVIEFDSLELENNNGSFPSGCLTLAEDGKLYGTTELGGSDMSGVLFSFDPATSTYTKLKDFGKDIDASQSVGNMMQASNGELYGMTIYGGKRDVKFMDEGILFSYNPGTNAIKLVWDFDNINGGPPTNNGLVEYKPVKMTKKDQSITFATLPNKEPGDTLTVISAIASSGLPVSISIVSGPALLSGDTLFITGKGSITVRAAQRGNTDFNPAPTIDRTFCALTAFYRDNDGDGFGNKNRSITACDITSSNYVSSNKDLNDNDGTIFPGAPELCDGKDNDSDGDTDEGCPEATTWYRDADGDGWGNANTSKIAPTQPVGYVSNKLDCNDRNKTKGGPEVCDGRDNDCDGVIDNGFELKPFYSDFDGDGYGTPKRMIMSCSAPMRFVSDSSDLNDDNGNVYPGAPELCDGRDNNQDGQIDEGFTRTTFYHDFDKDGYGRNEVTLQACAAPLNYVAVGGDCNDRNAAVHPGASGPPNDGIDNNCNGLIDEPLRNLTSSKGGEVGGEQELSLQLTATPNPAQHYFSLRIQSQSNKPVKLRIVDGLGRVVESRQGIAANSTLSIGHLYRPGVYYAEFVQEGKKATIKMVKQTE